MEYSVRISPVSALVALVVLLPGCGSHPASGISPIAGTARSWPYLGKARVVDAPKAMVVSGSPLASQVGRDILQQGGNAVDAAVAVGFALAVVHPEAGNIGGGGFMLIRSRDGQAQALDYRETAPGRASRDMYRDAGGDASLTGHLAAGVPGAVAGLTEAHRRFGRLPDGQ
jgi:gamma-glutamyltranspeptidase / glutathione hydrolase